MKFTRCLALSCLMLLGACGGSEEPARVAVLGKAQLAGPVVGGTLELRDEQGQVLATVPDATTEAGTFLLELPVKDRSRFRVTVRGGIYEGRAFADTLMLDVDGFRPGVDTLHLNAVTTLIGRYRDQYPGTSVATASERIKAFLRIPQASSAGFDVSNPLQNYFRHEALMAAVQASGTGRLDAYLAALAGEAATAGASRSFARSGLLGSGSGGFVEALFKFLGKELAGEGFGLVFEQVTTVLGLDGTAEILKELHEINQKLDELQGLSQELLTGQAELLLQSLVNRLEPDIVQIRDLYKRVATLAETPVRKCAPNPTPEPLPLNPPGPVVEPGSLNPRCEDLRDSELKLRKAAVAALRDEILNGANGATRVQTKLSIMADTLMGASTEPGLLSRANDFLVREKPFRVAVDDPKLLQLLEYYAVAQAAGVHMVVEAKMAQEGPAGESLADKVARKAAAKKEANEVLALYEKQNAPAQKARVTSLRYPDENTVEQWEAGLIWLRAPFSNLKTPQQNSGGGWETDWPAEARKICEQLARERYAGQGGWRLPTEKELHTFASAKGSPNKTGNADGGNGIFDWLVQQGFQRGPGNGQPNQRGIVVDSRMKTAYFSSTGVFGGYTEALWDYGVDSAADIPRFRNGDYIPSIAGAWCVTGKGGSN